MYVRQNDDKNNENIWATEKEKRAWYKTKNLKKESTKL